MEPSTWDKERYEEYIEDVKIARSEMKSRKLYPLETILCDLYALPSHNFQTYYAIIYECSGGLKMVYAKPQIYANMYAEPVKMYRFSTSREVQKHPGFDGRIIVGMKRLSDAFSEQKRNIIENLPDRHILGEKLIVIDGAFQAVRVFGGDAVIKEAAYYKADMIPFRNETEWSAGYLENLYLRVGELIGDHLNTEQKEMLRRMERR